MLHERDVENQTQLPSATYRVQAARFNLEANRVVEPQEPLSGLRSRSTKTRCQISKLSSRQSLSEWSRRFVRCSANNRSTLSGLKRPRFMVRSSRRSPFTISTCEPESHWEYGVGNPSFCRFRIAFGKDFFITVLRILLPVSPRVLREGGILSANSTRIWSKNGTRLYNEAAMLIWSCFKHSSTR